MTQERIVSVVIGDYSDDGHGKTNTSLFTLRGADVSDTALQESFAAAVEHTGVNPYHLCNDYENSRASGEGFDKIKTLLDSASAKSTGAKYRYGPSIFFDYPSTSEEGETWEDTEVDAAVLVIAYAGFAIPDFSWEEMIVPALIGGGGPIIREGHWGGQYGYGLL